MKKLFAAVCIFSLALASCNPESGSIAVTGISVAPSSLSLSVGDRAALAATVSPSDATNRSVIWSSNDVGVATVLNGTVVAVAPGNTTIIATSVDGGKTGTCSVTVKENEVPQPPTPPEPDVAVTGVTLTESRVDIYLGETITLTANVEPANATNKSVTWTSSAPGCASVDENGVVTGIDKGRAYIKATTVDGGFTAECEVFVNHIYPTKLIIVAPDGLDPSTGIVAGESFRLKVEFEPENATYRQVDWECMPKAYADFTVVADDEIEVHPLKPGTAKVKVTNNPGLMSVWPGTDKSFVINYAPAQAVSFGQSEIYLGYYTGKADAEKNYGQLSAKVLPEEFAKQDLEWWSDDPGIFKIYNTDNKNTCWYEVKGVGTTTVHARSASCPDVQGDCIVNISDERIYVQSIELSTTYLKRAPGSQFELTATVYPENVNYSDIHWELDEDAFLIYSGRTGKTPSLWAAPLKVGSLAVRLVDRISGISAECTLDVAYQNPAGYYQWVDLGLSVLWAKYNFFGGFYPGDNTRYPPANDRWTFFAFGELSDKSDYSESTYIYKSAYQLWDLMGDDGCLKPKYDVMTQYSGYSQWRMPTSEEWRELYDGCTWEIVTLDGATGMLGTSKFNGETIFLPYTGRMNGKTLEYESYYGYFWSRTMNQDATPDMVSIYRQYKNGHYDIGMSIDRYVNFQGFTVRGVLPKEYKP